MLPGLDGLQVTKLLKERPGHPEYPHRDADRQGRRSGHRDRAGAGCGGLHHQALQQESARGQVEGGFAQEKRGT